MAQDKPEFKILRQSDVLGEEREKLGLSTNEQPTALCLSGGGIRSAAFCLGTVQALARHGLLQHFHYLSTVSGGGYIGGWLTRWVAESNDCRDVAAVEEDIRASEATEPPEIQRLRSFTNFLTPRPGVASNDTWAGLVLWLRNTVVNWTVFFPLMLAAATVPILYVALICTLASAVEPELISIAWGFCALLCLGVSVYRSCINLPSHQHPDPNGGPKAPDRYGISTREVWQKIVIWSLLWGFLVPLSFVPLLLHASKASWLEPPFGWQSSLETKHPCGG
jgi:hypothetical protein